MGTEGDRGVTTWRAPTVARTCPIASVTITCVDLRMARPHLGRLVETITSGSVALAGLLPMSTPLPLHPPDRGNILAKSAAAVTPPSSLT